MPLITLFIRHENEVMPKFANLDELREACPPDTHLVGPTDADGLEISVNGRIEAACLRPDGTRQGPSITWYENGSKAMAGDYCEGLKQGEWSFWHDNGQISGRGNFSQDKPNGLWVTWHDNGQKESEGTYLEGLHHGRFTHWDRNGHIVKVLHYEHGKLIKSIPYRNGRPT
jgi:antitoxin component YwqK of YwqJK toxin-antitoxin module